MRFPGLSKKPAIYIVGDDGSERLARQHAAGDFIVIEEIAPHFRLRLGPDVLDILNTAYNPAGIAAGHRHDGADSPARYFTGQNPVSGPRDFEDDELEPAKPPWWRQRRALTLGGASLIVIALFAVSQTQRAPAPPAAKSGPDFIGVVVPYTPAKAAPVPPPALSRPLPQVMPAMATPAAPVTRPAMLSYKVDIKDPPAAKAADPPDQTGLQIGTAKIPGVKASPAIDETYLLMPGLLPCVLDTAILSDLPGPLMCHLPGPVYSSKGVLLMEAGTQVIGQYQSLKNNGVRRLLAVSTYAHTPEGIWVPLTGNPLADDLGRSGLDGAVDNHYLQRFGGAVLLDLTQSGLQNRASRRLQGRQHIHLDQRHRQSGRTDFAGDDQYSAHVFEKSGRDDRDLARQPDRLLRQLPHPAEGRAMKMGETTLRHLLAPIQDVLDDPATTEIVAQRPGEVGIEQHGQWWWRDVEAFDFRRLDAIGLLGGLDAVETVRPGEPDLPDDAAGRATLHHLPAAGDRTRDDLAHDPHPIEVDPYAARPGF